MSRRGEISWRLVFTLRSETPVVFKQRNKGMISFCLCFTKVALAAGWEIKDRKGRVSAGRETGYNAVIQR